MDLLFSGNFREMLIIFGLMLVLLQTGSCVQRICSFNQTETCYAALEGKLSLRMIQDINISRLELKKEESLICRIHNGTIMKSGLYSNRSDVINSNDTVVINNMPRADSGNYTLHLYDLQSKRIPTPGLQVNVEAPIGSVKVSVECIRGVWWASCSSEGDSLFYNWTLNGKPLAQGNKTTINLNGETSGNITCSVMNHISHGEKSITVNYCTGTTPTAITTATTASVTSDVTPVLTNNKQTSELGEETTTTATITAFATTTASVTSHPTSTLTNNKQTSDSGQVSVTFVIVWTLQMIFLLLLLGGFHIYIRKRTSTQTPEEKQQEDIVLYENWNNIRH